MDTLDGSAAEAGDAGHRRADGLQPVNGIVTVLAEGADQFRIVQALAADHGIQLKQLCGVEVVSLLVICLVGIPLLLDLGCQRLDRLIVGPLLLRGSEGLLNTCLLGKFVLVLKLRIARVQSAGGTDGVAAHHGLALQDDDVLSAFFCFDRRDHACAAGADHDHVDIDHLVIGLFHGLGSHCDIEGRRVDARALQSRHDALLDGVGGQGRAGHAVHLDALFLKDLRGDLHCRDRTDPLGLLLVDDLDGIDAVLRGDDFHRHRSVHSLGRSCTCHRFRGDILQGDAAVAGGVHLQDIAQIDRDNDTYHDQQILQDPFCVIHAFPPSDCQIDIEY